MNKKLLGIAAVALLGVSAAFAATTSTVYFTASGSLTKVVDPLNGIEQTDDNPGGRDHANEAAIGVSLVETSFTKVIGGGNQHCEGRYKGESINTDTDDNKLTVKYSTVGRVANPDTTLTSYSATNPPYIYKEMILENLRFSSAYDYYYIPFYIVNFSDNAQYINGMYAYGSSTNYNASTTPTEITLKDSYKAYYYINTSSSYVDPNSNPSKQGDTEFYQEIDSKTMQKAFLIIYVTSDYTGSDAKFDNVTINLANFEGSASTGATALRKS